MSQHTYARALTIAMEAGASEAQARERFGYLMPGEKSYVVLDKDGKPIESQATLSNPKQVLRKETKAWWAKEWESVQLAGNPSAAR